MRTVLAAAAGVLGCTFFALSVTDAAADAAKPKSAFVDQQRFGLGADVPDDLLFSDPAIDRTPNQPRVTVRRASPRITKRGPILKGWDNIAVEVEGEQGWQTSAPVKTGCLDSHAIMSALAEAGWSRFARYNFRPRSIAFNARRRDGRTKRVQIDRCTGEIIHVSAAYSN